MEIRTRRRRLPGTRRGAEKTPQGVLLRTVRRTGKQTLDEGLAAMHALANVRGRPKTLGETDAAVASEARKAAGRAPTARSGQKHR